MITICWLRITSIFDAAQQTTDHDVAMLNNEKKRMKTLSAKIGVKWVVLMESTAALIGI